MPTAQGKSSAFNIGAATRTHLLLFTPHPLMGEFGLGGGLIQWMVGKKPDTNILGTYTYGVILRWYLFISLISDCQF